MIKKPVHIALMFLSLVLVAATGCSDSGEDKGSSCSDWSVTCVDQLPADKKLDELSSGEQSCLCNWYAIQMLGAAETECAAEGEKSNSAVPGLIKACSDPTEPHLPCPVQDLMACVRAYVSSPCEAADAAACQSLGDCVRATQPATNDLSDLLCADSQQPCWSGSTNHGEADFPRCVDEYYFFYYTCGYCSNAHVEGNANCRKKYPDCSDCLIQLPAGYY